MTYLAENVFIVFFCSLLTLTIVSTVVYRLCFHPLAKVPGPRLAALTSLYELYFDCILGGKFVFKISDLHKQYGPIVRLSPREVHIDDPAFFDQLYNVTGKLDKDKWYYAFVASQDAGFGTANAERHRMRRKAMSRFFSTSAIASLESSSKTFVGTLRKRLQEYHAEARPVNLSNAFRCLAADSVTGYCMPEPFRLLESVEFAEDYNRQSRAVSWLAVWHRHIPIVIPMFMAMPRWFVKLTSPDGGLMAFDFQTGLAEQAERAASAEKRSDDTVLDGIINSDLPECDKTAARLTQEARTLVGAGTETTGLTLEIITYHVLVDTSIKTRLKLELEEAVARGGDLSSSETLKSLQYLTAVIKEGLRLANSVSGRLSRVDPKHRHIYDSHVLPPGTVMSMNLTSLHMNEDTFPQPTKFQPDRWLDAGNQNNLEKNFAPFSRGARSCVGKELAMMNLYMTVANFFHDFDAELFETTYSDLAMEHDFFSPFPKSSSSGLRVLLK